MTKLKKPTSAGEVITAELPMTKAAPKRPNVQSGGVVSAELPLSFGKKGGSTSGSGKKKSSRRKMY